MSSEREYRRLVVKMARSSLAREQRQRSLRESLDTLVLGLLSTSIGVIILIALFSGMVGSPAPDWDRAAVAIHTKYLIPTLACAAAAVVGESLGLAGTLLGRIRHGTTSPLSILGTIICLGQICQIYRLF